MAGPGLGQKSPTERVPFGHYVLLETVAEGRLGTLHRATRSDGSQPGAMVAIRRMQAELSLDPAFAACFADVMARAKRVEHESCRAILEAGRAPDGTLFTALPWVQGKDLKQVVTTLRKANRTMVPTLVAHVGVAIAQGLDAAHRLEQSGQPSPLHHGELSANDILIGYDGRVRLSGLGSAELAAVARLPSMRAVYRAPELARGAEPDARSDVFSLGACLYQVLTITGEVRTERELPQGSDRPDSRIRQIVPHALLEIVRRAVAEDPGARWQSASELAKALASWLSTQTSPGGPSNLAAFMSSIFEDARSGPMNDPVERTPTERKRSRKDSGEQAKVARAASAVANAQPAVDDANADREAESVAALAGAIAVPNAERRASEAGWDDEPWESSAEQGNPWSVAPPERPVVSARPTPVQLPATVPMPAKPSARSQPARGSSPPTTAPVPARASAPPSTTTPLPARASAPLATTPLPAPRASAAPSTASLPLPPSRSADAVFAPQVSGPPSALRWAVPAAALFVSALLAFFLLRGPDAKPAPKPDAAAPEIAAAAQPPTEPAPAPAVEPPAAPSEVPVEEPAVAAAPEPTAVEPPPQDSPAAERVERASSPRHSRPEPARSERAAPVVAPDPVPPRSVVENERSPAPEPPVVAKVEPPAPAPTPATEPRTEPASPAGAPPRAAEPSPPPAASSAPRGETRAATLIAQRQPEFPKRAKRSGITEGQVAVDYTVDRNGQVRDIRVVSSKPKGFFDQAAIDALQQWKYRPKLVDGVPSESRHRFTFRFQ